MSRSWAGGSTTAWRKLRASVLEDNLLNNGGWCVLNIPGVCTGPATCAHHTQGRAVTGDDPRHLVAACEACNLHIGDPTKHADPAPRPLTKW